MKLYEKVKEFIEVITFDTRVQEYVIDFHFDSHSRAAFTTFVGYCDSMGTDGFRYKVVSKPNGFKGDEGLIRVGCNSIAKTRQINSKYSLTQAWLCGNRINYYSNNGSKLVNGVCYVIAMPR